MRCHAVGKKVYVIVNTTRRRTYANLKNKISMIIGSLYIYGLSNDKVSWKTDLKNKDTYSQNQKERNLQGHILTSEA